MAKKSKEFSKMLRKQQAQGRMDDGTHKLVEQFKQRKIAQEPNFVLVPTAPDMEKMSDILQAFFRPFLLASRGFQEDEFIVDMAIIAWNLSFVDDLEKQRSLIEEAV